VRKNGKRKDVGEGGDGDERRMMEWLCGTSGKKRIRCVRKTRISAAARLGSTKSNLAEKKGGSDSTKDVEATRDGKERI